MEAQCRTQLTSLSDAGRPEVRTDNSSLLTDWESRNEQYFSTVGLSELAASFNVDDSIGGHANYSPSPALRHQSDVFGSSAGDVFISSCGSGVAPSSSSAQDYSVCESAPQISPYYNLADSLNVPTFAGGHGLTTLAAAAAATMTTQPAAGTHAFQTDPLMAESDVFTSLIKNPPPPLVSDSASLNAVSSFMDGAINPRQCASPGFGFHTLSVNQLPLWERASPLSFDCGEPADVPSLGFKRDSRKRRASVSSLTRDGQPKFRKTENQLAVLVKYFSVNRLPDRESVEKLSDVTGLTISEVKNWFRNRRLRYKDTKEPTKKKQQIFCNGSLTPSQNAFLESMTDCANNVNPYGRYQRKAFTRSVPSSSLSSYNEQNYADDLSPARRSERLRSKHEARASFETALLRWAGEEQRSNGVMSGAGTGLTIDEFSPFDSSLPSILVTPSELKEAFDFVGDGSHSLQPLVSSHCNGMTPSDHLGSLEKTYLSSTTSDLTPPTSPSLSRYINQQQGLGSNIQQVPSDSFEEVSGSLHEIFKAYLPDSTDRKELLKCLLKDLDSKEKTAVQLMINTQSYQPDRLEVTSPRQAKEAWKELEERFGVTSASKGEDTPPRSDLWEDDSSSECSQLPCLDPNMLEGLKCMFQCHRDYLYAVAQNLGVAPVVTVKEESLPTVAQ
eukprot:m.306158 g.306158  ORF g.306158 m.306158 type:complete len:672 (+) comp41013_c0_seq1:173-2188(+)